MQNTIKLFDRFPSIFPTAFENTFLSGSIFDEFDKVFNSQKLKQMSVYPTDIYNVKDENEQVIATVIEMAMAGIDKDNCSINIENNELILNIGNVISDANKSDEEDTSENKFTKEYIQKQISGRSAVMRWTLGNKIDKDNISVKYKNGILKITLPFVHFLEKASREIPID